MLPKIRRTGVPHIVCGITPELPRHQVRGRHRDGRLGRCEVRARCCGGTVTFDGYRKPGSQLNGRCGLRRPERKSRIPQTPAGAGRRSVSRGHVAVAALQRAGPERRLGAVIRVLTGSRAELAQLRFPDTRTRLLGGISGIRDNDVYQSRAGVAFDRVHVLDAIHPCRFPGLSHQVED